MTFVGKQPGEFWGITADPSGKFLVITQRDGPIQSYQVNSNGTLTPVIGREFPLAEGARAHEAVMASGALGKIVLLV